MPYDGYLTFKDDLIDELHRKFQNRYKFDNALTNIVILKNDVRITKKWIDIGKKLHQMESNLSND